MDLVKFSFTICVFISILYSCVAQGSTTTTRQSVNTTKGEVIGWLKESKATAGKYMRVFNGIPFAKPPINELRFLDPLPANNWTEAMNLSQDDPLPCPQLRILITGDYSEDCLFVNVFTPAEANSTSKLPVVVWIYGGGFLFGTSSSLIYGPDYFVEQNVVYVSLNYRVGIFGFLNLGTDKVPGNAGLKDQLLALQWVQTEIANFGGDPTKVTLFGESAGAASVIMHYLAPKSKNLFRYAIADSGNALADWTFIESNVTDIATSYSKYLNCTSANNTANLTCLQSVPAQTLLYVSYSTLLINSNSTVGSLVFTPSLEKPSASAFLDDTPANLLAKLTASTTDTPPLLTGINKDEGVLQLKANASFYKPFYANLEQVISYKYRVNRSDADIQKAVALIKTSYFGNVEPSLANLTGYINLFTDRLFGVSTATFARQLASMAKIYLYSFEFNGAFKAPTALNISKVAHGDELGYLFWRNYLNQSAADQNSTSITTLKRMVKMWTNFVKTGNPTPDGTSDSVLENVMWSPITVGSYHYLRITEHLNMSTDNFKEDARLLWNRINGVSFGTRTSASVTLISIVLFITAYFV